MKPQFRITTLIALLVVARASGVASAQQIIGTTFEASRTDPCGFAADPLGAAAPGDDRFVWAWRNDPGLDPALRGVVIADWADIPGDTVFNDMFVRLAIFVSDDDATPEVVEGSRLAIRVFDADDGFDDPNRVLLAETILDDLPADQTGGDGLFLTIGLRFPQFAELGNTGALPDGDVSNGVSFADLDGDGLHDFGYEIEVSAPDGAIGAGIGVVLVGPDLSGGASPDPTTPAGMTDLYEERLPSSEGGAWLGTFGFGGAQCGAGAGAGEGTVPFAQAFFGLRIGPCTPADLALPFNIVDLSDVDTFIDAFVNGDPLADFAPPFGIIDLSDIDTFIPIFLMGCP
ncbi:MAG: GC-type dockerin domain-anchored protein [Planctomycetota bacterium]